MWIYIWFALAMLEAAAILWLVARVMRLQGAYRISASSAAGASRVAARLFKAENELRSVLQEIADQEAPGANATVKRMARIAREGLS